MQEAWVPGTLTVIFGMLLSLHGVSSNQSVYGCEDSHCPKGFRCCDNECCQERKIWDPENDPFRIVFIILFVMLPLLYICGLVKCFCPKCKKLLRPEVRRANHQIPPEPPSIAPLESIWVTSLEPLPTYSQVVLNSTTIDPPPPYSLRPEGPTGQMRGTRYATL